MQTFGTYVTWIYIVFLLAGGLIGFLKAKSKVSLVTSVVAAALLALAAVPGVFQPGFARGLTNIVMAALLVVFALRFVQTKKFMPSGLLIVVTALALALRNITF
jgi:uncharacterized membrane protein (UPF0136 family)